MLSVWALSSALLQPSLPTDIGRRCCMTPHQSAPSVHAVAPTIPSAFTDFFNPTSWSATFPPPSLVPKRSAVVGVVAAHRVIEYNEPVEFCEFVRVHETGVDPHSDTHGWQRPADVFPRTHEARQAQAQPLSSILRSFRLGLVSEITC